MKRILLISIISLYSYVSIAQYSFNTTLTPYNDLSNPTSLNNGTVWNEGTNFQVYFNFNFQINGQTYTALNVVAGGGLNFPGFGIKELFVYHTPFGGYLLKDKGTTSSLSSISYEITGNTGQHLLKIQWKNANLLYTTGSINDFVDFQIWLFENDNHLEIHFGNHSTTPGTYGYPDYTSDSNPGSSVKFEFDQCSNILGVTGPCDLPSYNFYSLCTPNYTFIDGTPSVGITYNFHPTQLNGISQLFPNQINIFPNPVHEQLNITGIPSGFFLEKISILDLTGRIIYNQDYHSDDNDINISLSTIDPGIYFIRLTAKDGKLIVKRVTCL